MTRATRNVAVLTAPVTLVCIALTLLVVKDGWLAGDRWDRDPGAWRGVHTTQSLLFVYDAVSLLLLAAVVCREHASTDGPTKKHVAGRGVAFMASPLLPLLLLCHVWFDVVARDLLAVTLVGGLHVLLLLYTVRLAQRTKCTEQGLLSVTMLLAFGGVYVPAVKWYFDNMV